MTTKPEIGTIIHATLRNEDLLPAFLFALEEIDQASATRFNSELIELGFGYSQCGVCFGPSEDWPVDADSETISEIIMDISDALDHNAPEGCYFGAHGGDGSDFGFWPIAD